MAEQSGQVLEFLGGEFFALLFIVCLILALFALPLALLRKRFAGYALTLFLTLAALLYLIRVLVFPN